MTIHIAFDTFNMQCSIANQSIVGAVYVTCRYNQSILNLAPNGGATRADCL
jgi:hypothetical protein